MTARQSATTPQELHAVKLVYFLAKIECSITAKVYAPVLQNLLSLWLLSRVVCFFCVRGSRKNKAKRNKTGGGEMHTPLSKRGGVLRSITVVQLCVVFLDSLTFSRRIRGLHSIDRRCLEPGFLRIGGGGTGLNSRAKLPGSARTGPLACCSLMSCNVGSSSSSGFSSEQPSVSTSSTIGEGEDVTYLICPRFERERHENSPYREQI